MTKSPTLQVSDSQNSKVEMLALGSGNAVLQQRAVPLTGERSVTEAEVEAGVWQTTQSAASLRGMPGVLSPLQRAACLDCGSRKAGRRVERPCRVHWESQLL